MAEKAEREAMTAVIEAMLAEILFKPENRKLMPRGNISNPKLQLTADDWNPASHSGDFFVMPIRNKKCTKDSCTYEVNQIVRQFVREKITSSASNYNCASCGFQRSIKDLSIDLNITGIVSKLRNARYDQLIRDCNTDDEKEFQHADSMHLKVEKSGLVGAVTEHGEDIVKDGVPLFRSFILVQDAEDGLRRIKPEIKSALTTANSEISKVLSNTKENFELFKDIFGGDNPFESNLAFSELKEGLGIFEFTEQRFDPKQLKNKEITFLLWNEMLNIHYPGLGLTFVDVKLALKSGGTFTIPPGAKLSTFIDKTEMVTKILITGGFNKEGKAISTNYEVSLTPYTEGGRIVLKALVEEKNAMKKPKYCHSIVWHPKNQQIYIIGGVGDPRGPTASVEVGEREKGDWVWFSAKELLKPRICGSACVAGEYIYIFGGHVKKNIDDYPRIGDSAKFPVPEIERLNLTTNKSEIITELKVEMPAYYICFPNSFEKPEEIIFLGGKDQNVNSFDVTKNQMTNEKAKIGDFAPPDGNQGWTIYMSQVITMVPTVGKGFKLLKYDLTNKYIQYSDLKI